MIKEGNLLDTAKIPIKSKLSVPFMKKRLDELTAHQINELGINGIE
ncbi:hypothetical protein FACS189440_22080 [Bacteroidia bacterium]|nr:hypothetical protein FACS189440_22080 [Bacteroidia bacterium]